MVDVERYRWRDGHSQIVAQPVVAYALGAAARGQHIDGYGAVGHGNGAEGCAMQGAHNGEEQQCASHQIACKEDEKQEKAHHEHLLARETVHHIAAEGAHEHGGDRVARKHQSNHILGGAKAFAQVERQQRGEQIEGEKQQEIGCHHLDEITVPQYVFRFACGCVHGVVAFFRFMYFYKSATLIIRWLNIDLMTYERGAGVFLDLAVHKIANARVACREHNHLVLLGASEHVVA